MPSERCAFRHARVPLRDTARIAPEDLAERTGVALERCRMFAALAQFQSLRSVGPSLAEDIYNLGFRSCASLAEADPAMMYSSLCRQVGARVDPCVEDVFRCAVAQARDPSLPDEAQNWWYWTHYRGTSVTAAKCEA
jgi:hypothetical protein